MVLVPMHRSLGVRKVGRLVYASSVRDSARNQAASGSTPELRFVSLQNHDLIRFDSIGSTHPSEAQ